MPIETVFHMIYLVATGAMSSLSILGSCFTIATFILLPKFKRQGRQLIIYLSIADFGIALGNILGLGLIGQQQPLGDAAFCELQAVLSNLASMSSFLWNVCIAVYLYLVLVHNKTERAESLRPFYHLLCWLLPVIIVMITLGFRKLGMDTNTKNPSWCWIQDGANQLYWQLFCCKAWEVCVYIIIGVLYTLIVISLKKQKKALSRTLENDGNPSHRLSAFAMISEANRKLMCVPIVFFLLRIWGTTRFMINAVDVKRDLASHMVWLAPIQGLGDSGQGFANCVLYCFLPGHVRKALWVKFRCLSMRNIGPLPTSSALAPPAAS